jgi:hypothetical protein
VEFALDIVDDVRVVFQRTEVRHPIPARHRVGAAPGVVAEYHEVFAVGFDFGVVTAVYTRVLPSIRTVTVTMSFGSESRTRACSSRQ